MGHRGSCCDLCQSVLPIFYSMNFTVSGLTFRPLIHFVFVYGVRKCSNFILLHMVDQFSQHHLLNRMSFLSFSYFFESVFSPLYIFASFVKDKVSIGVQIYL